MDKEQWEEIVMHNGLDAGFMMSTDFGQDTNKLMPTTDRATLDKFAQAIWNEALEAASVAVEKEFDGEGVWAIPKIILSLKRKI